VIAHPEPCPVVGQAGYELMEFNSPEAVGFKRRVQAAVYPDVIRKNRQS
jgi:hypothetical protein